MVNEAFKEQLPVLIELLKKHKIKKAYFFGSVLTEKFTAKSDLDILINFRGDVTDPLEKGGLLWDLRFAIEDILNRQVDLLQESSLKNSYFIKEMNETKELIYEQ